MKSPLISVIIAVYNAERYVTNAIESVLCQTFRDFELIIIDDGSTDNSPDIVYQYAKRDPRIVVVHQSNHWIYPTFNRGVRMARGEYVTICNCDDMLVPDALEIIAGYIQKYHVDVVFENVSSNACDENQNIITANFQHSCMDQEFVIFGHDNIIKSWHTFMCYGLVRNNMNTYRTELLRRHPYREDIYGADFLINIDIANDIESVACSPKDLYIFFQYMNSSTLNISIGKYTPYEHAMFNEFYQRYVDLFCFWDLYTDEIANSLCGLRISQLQPEYRNLFADNCQLSPKERVMELLSYMDDIVYYCSMKLNKFDEEEAKILSYCGHFINSQTKYDRQSLIVQAMDCFAHPLRDKRELEILRKFVSMKGNPNHLGLSFYESSVQKYGSKSAKRYASYLKLKRAAKFAYLDNDTVQMSELLPALERASYNDPERMSILCGIALSLGNIKEAFRLAEEGMQLFPKDIEIKENYEYLSALLSGENSPA